MGINRYVGPNGGHWNVTSNWSNNDNNYNCECEINLGRGGGGIPTPGVQPIVYYDANDGPVGPVGSLTIIDTTLALRSQDALGALLSVGNINLRGSGSITLAQGWLVQSANLLMQHQSILTLSRGSFWNAFGFHIGMHDQSALNCGGAIWTDSLNSGLLTRITFSGAIFNGDINAGGRVWVSYPANIDSPQDIVTRIDGNALLGGICHISISNSLIGVVVVSGDLTIPNGAIPFQVGPNPRPVYNYAFVQGQAVYPDGTVNIGGITYYASFRTFPNGTVLFWSQTPPSGRGGLPPSPPPSDPSNPGQSPPP